MSASTPTVDQAAAALAFTLDPFEGKPVTRAAVEIPGAAGGLRDALKVEPRHLPQGQRVYVLLECDVKKVRHDPIDAEDFAGPQARVHILDVIAGTLMDPEVAKPAIDDQKERIQKAVEDAAGIMRLDLDGAADGGDSPEREPARPGTPDWALDPDGFLDYTAIRNALTMWNKDQLRALAEAHDVAVAKNATGAKLIDALVEGITDLPSAMDAAAQEA